MDTYNLIKKAYEKAGLERVKYVDKNVPTNADNIVILPFFGDLRSSFILSKLLLKRYREQVKGSKYFIVISWPGDEILYPFADEFWTVKNEFSLEDLKRKSNGFLNTHEFYSSIMRSLNYFFSDVIDPIIFNDYYENGLTIEFFNKFKDVSVYSPPIPSSISSLGIETSKNIQTVGPSIVVYPSKNIRKWNYEGCVSSVAPKGFWVYLCKKLLKDKITPIVCLNELAYDISKEVSKCVFVDKLNTGQMLTLMRSVGCSLDVFNGTSKLAVLAKSPFIAFDERNRFFGNKEYELDDLCALNIPREYIFSFSSIVSDGDESDWESNIVNPLLIKLNLFLPKLDRDSWETLSEKEELVEYSSIRKKNMLKLGTKFIKVEQLNSD